MRGYHLKNGLTFARDGDRIVVTRVVPPSPAHLTAVAVEDMRFECTVDELASLFADLSAHGPSYAAFLTARKFLLGEHT